MKNYGTLNESFDRFTFESEDMTVTQCRFDFGLTFVIGGRNGSAEIRIESPFELTIDDDGPNCLAPGDGPAALASALGILNRKVLLVAALKTGDLELECESARVRVPSSEKFEAWTLSTEDGGSLVSMPGKELRVWLPNR